MKRAMIDFETLGTGTSACVIQMGACYFGEMHELPEVRTFKCNVDPNDAVNNGAVIDAPTVLWWLAQSEDARKSVTSGERLPELEAYQALNDFLSKADEVWSHATFDFVILTEALKRYGLKPKFHYRAARDIRTLVALSTVDTKSLKREGTHHDALDDAIFQAAYCLEMLKGLGK